MCMADIPKGSSFSIDRRLRSKAYAALLTYGLSMTLPMTEAYAASKGQASVPTARAEYIIHIMQKGDTFDTVAQQYGMSAEELKKINKPFEGQWSPAILIVPSTAIVDSGVFHPRYAIYVMRRGDTLNSVAAHYNRSAKELTNLNAAVMPMDKVVTAKEGSSLLVPATPTSGNAQSASSTSATEQKVASTLSSLGESLSDSDVDSHGEQLKDQALGQATGMATSAVEQSIEGFLNKKGTAKIGINANIDEGDVDYSLDYLHPLLETETSTLFTQIGVRTSDERNIGNLGIGYRAEVNEGLVLGANAFVDQDFSRDHTRGSLGVEAWAEAARVAANVYAPLSGWKKSDDHDLNSDSEKYILEERPAKGWDLNFEGPVPGVQQLAVTAEYFQWQGDKVDVQGSGSEVEEDPSGYSVGIKWQPVPLVGFVAEHTEVSGSDSDFSVGMDLTWSFDRSLTAQLDSANSFAVKPLAQSRKELVQRNNEIVLEYREKNKAPVLAPLRFPVDVIEGVAGQHGLGPQAEGVQPGYSLIYSSSHPDVVRVHPETGYLVSAATLASSMAYVSITATESGTSQEHSSSSRTASFQIELTAQSSVPTATNLNIQGYLVVGRTLTGSYVFADHDGDTRNDATNDASTILWTGGGTQGDTDHEYILTSADVGKVLRFSVKPKTLAGTVGPLESITTGEASGVVGGGTTPPGSVVAEAIPSVSNLNISGELQVGNTLNGTFDFADNDGDTSNDATSNASTLSWTGGGNSGVTSKDYTLTGADVGKVLTFHVTPMIPSGTVGKAESMSTADAPGVIGGGTTPPGSIVDAAYIPSASNLDIAGVLEVGQVLTGSYVFADNDKDTTNDLSNNASELLWTGGGTSDDMDSTYTLDVSDTGKVLTFNVTPKTVAGALGSVVSVTTAGAPGAIGGGTTPPGGVINPSAKPEVSNLAIVGTLDVGQTLVGQYVFADHDGNTGNDAQNDDSTLLWTGGGTSGNQTTTYTLASADVGKVLAFNVRAKNINGNTGNVERVTTVGTVADSRLPTSVAVHVAGRGVLTGHPVVGQTLEAVPVCDVACAPNLAYQWAIQTSVGGQFDDIPGAQGKTYTVLASQQKRQFMVSASMADAIPH